MAAASRKKPCWVGVPEQAPASPTSGGGTTRGSDGEGGADGSAEGTTGLSSAEGTAEGSGEKEGAVEPAGADPVARDARGPLGAVAPQPATTIPSTTTSRPHRRELRPAPGRPSLTIGEGSPPAVAGQTGRAAPGSRPGRIRAP